MLITVGANNKEEKYYFSSSARESPPRTSAALPSCFLDMTHATTRGLFFVIGGCAIQYVFIVFKYSTVQFCVHVQYWQYGECINFYDL